MKIQFDPDLDYQRKSVNSIVDIFQGQEAPCVRIVVAAAEIIAARLSNPVSLPGAIF